MKTRFLLTVVALLSFAMGIRAEIKPYTYYLVGNMNSWAPNESYEMKSLSGGVYVQREVSLTTSSEFKVVKTGENATEASSYAWLPDGVGNNQTVEADGTYDVYFRPDGGGLATEGYVLNSGLYYFCFTNACTCAGVSTVTLNGGFNNWGKGFALTQTSENTWTGVFDTSSYATGDNPIGDFDMKLVVNGGGDEMDNWGGWIGWGNVELSAPAGWLTEGEVGNIAFNHSTTGYTAYNITATWEPNTFYYKGWNLTIAGKSDDALAISEENFPDYYFQEYIKEVFDEDNDGYLSKDEIAAATFINIPSGSYISDLTGIKNFTSLEILNCYDNNDINEIDVAGMTSLVYLNCYNSKIMNIKAAGCTNLEHVDCHKNMEGLMMMGGSLDFTGCTSLQTLYCQGFGVANWSFLSDEPQDNFKISDCTALRQLNCAGNHIGGELDLTAMTNLQRLDCNNCGLSSLKVDGLASLETLNCYENRLISLTVTGCAALEEIECYSNYINIQNMEAFVNSLPTVEEGSLTVRVSGYYGIKSKGVKYDMEELRENEMTNEQVAIAKSKGWNVERLKYEYDYWLDEGDYYPYDYSGSVAITPANFPDAKLREYLSKLDNNGDANGYVSEDEREDFGFGLYGMWGDELAHEVKDLTGIKLYDDSHAMSITGTKATKLDVSGMKNLIGLVAAFNKISTFDVSGCDDLELIFIPFNNLSGSNMDAFINSLPQAVHKPSPMVEELLDGVDQPTIVLKGSDVFLAEMEKNKEDVIEELGYYPEEGNEMTPKQVAAAKAKGWRVVVMDDWSIDNLHDYAGKSDDAPLDTFTVDKINYLVISYNEPQVLAHFMYTSAKEETNILLPDSVSRDGITFAVKQIGVEAFVNDLSVVSLTTPKTVEEIGDRALMHCVNLKDVNLANGLKKIGDAAFAGCTGIVTINIPGTVKEIGFKCFSKCDGLTDIYFDGTKEQWNEIPGIKMSGIAKSVTIHFKDGETEGGAGDITGIGNAAANNVKKDGKYMENGRLVIRKNGNTFNAAGQR